MTNLPSEIYYVGIHSEYIKSIEGFLFRVGQLAGNTKVDKQYHYDFEIQINPINPWTKRDHSQNKKESRLSRQLSKLSRKTSKGYIKVDEPDKGLSKESNKQPNKGLTKQSNKQSNKGSNKGLTKQSNGRSNRQSNKKLKKSRSEPERSLADISKSKKGQRKTVKSEILDPKKIYDQRIVRIVFSLNSLGKHGDIYITNAEIPGFPKILNRLLESDPIYLKSCIIIEDNISNINFNYPWIEVMKLGITTYSVDNNNDVFTVPPILHLLRKLTEQPIVLV